MPGVLIIAGLYGAVVAWLVSLIVAAPEGWEEPGVGFHYGPEPFDDELRRLADRDGRAPVPFLHTIGDTRA